MSAEEFNEGRGILLSIKKKKYHTIKWNINFHLFIKHILNICEISTVKCIKWKIATHTWEMVSNSSKIL